MSSVIASLPHRDRPWCALCGERTVGRARTVELLYGVVVHLCAPHATPAFLTRDGGRAVAEALERTWLSAGCLNQRRRRALDAHVRRVTSGGELPQRAPSGSYTWPDVRREVLRRRDAGQPFAAVMDWVRVTCAPSAAAAPSPRTIRRWWRQPTLAAPGIP